ncbi:LysM peptidoglycan-binding domain-containing protein [Niveibacterium sp. 24ML]|uniref:LysM peptidoglycan-binding domain-containing protein n=1 Tax=Niveibacterium sp. 24ML TaxID=2985512 RepID=UPI002270CD81|nr:LysM peptidoglycan-binding domain-containing protein [Niveibacterium sp. 24ML]MCX9157321.1 LysM peptidoglycan-binding domain-containing protein [Niveibacterium sp. 24ML]
MFRIISVLALTLGLSFASASAVADTVKLAENAPDSYVVVKGDTLWDISGKFLKHPWLWPQVWRMNREQIKDPHWIYPGQTIYLDRSGPYLSTTPPGGGGTEKLSPQVRAEDLSPIPSVPLSRIERFLTRPLFISDKDLAGSATIVASDARLLNGPGNTVFARGVTAGVSNWQIYRRAQPVKDPVTNELLGYEAADLGTARVSQEGELATMEITSVQHEVHVGDRMLPATKAEFFSLAPHAPSGAVSGRIVKIPDGLESTGKFGVVTISVGRAAGLEPGHVLAIYRTRPNAKYDMDGSKEVIKLPDERIGFLFVFRVFDRVAYGLVVESDGPVKITDEVRQP